MHRFFLNRVIEDPKNIVIKDKEIINKINKVLRKKVGDRFLLFDIQANDYEVEIKAKSSKEISCSFVRKNFIERELKTNIILYQALLKKDKLEWILQKATEIGVKKIVPVLSGNCVIKELKTAKIKRYQKILQEATLQCGGKKMPELSKLTKFEQAVEQVNVSHLNLIAHEQEQDNKLVKILVNNKNLNINLFIGPEGGFLDQEINLARSFSFQTISLGSRILRAETAAVVSCGIIANI